MKLLIAILFFFLGIISVFAYQKWQPSRSNLVGPSPVAAMPVVSRDELSKGWYWGDETQEKSGTPDDWVFQEAGRSSCWHAPAVACD